MTLVKPFLMIATILLLASCAPINTQFSCNQTAGDNCLSMEEVNAMTEIPQEQRIKSQPYQRHQNRAQVKTIWIAPWKDKQGQWHQEDVLLATLDKHVNSKRISS